MVNTVLKDLENQVLALSPEDALRELEEIIRRRRAGGQ